MKRRRLQARRLKHQPFTRLIPNALTLLNMCAGATALRFALNDRFEAAVAAILLAGVLDLLDGGMARLLHAGSKLGAELLFDVISADYERTSVLVNTTLPFERWVEVLGCERLTGATLDRLTHRCHVLEANGQSYRLKDAKRRHITKPSK